MLTENAYICDNLGSFFQDTESQAFSRKLALSINDWELTPETLYWVNRLENMESSYSTIFAHRTRYLWAWIETAFQLTSLKIPNEYSLLAHSLKCRIIFLAILLDDICDVEQSEKQLYMGLSILTGFVPSKDGDTLYLLIYDLWVSISHDIENTPNYNLLCQDIRQACKKLSDSFVYGLSALKRLLAGEKIWHFYLNIIPHSNCIYLAGLIDLLYTPLLSSIDLGVAKHLLENTQKMAQIGNWLSTYEREVKQNDFSSGVIIFGLEKGWLNYNQIQQPINVESVMIAIKKSSADNSLLNMWKTLQNESYTLQQQCDSHLFQGYVKSFSTLLSMQMGSIGLT